MCRLKTTKSKGRVIPSIFRSIILQEATFRWRGSSWKVVSDFFARKKTKRCAIWGNMLHIVIAAADTRGPMRKSRCWSHPPKRINNRKLTCCLYISPCKFFFSFPFSTASTLYPSHLFQLCRDESLQLPDIDEFCIVFVCSFSPTIFLFLFFFRSKLSTLERVGSVCRGRSPSWSSHQISPRSFVSTLPFPNPSCYYLSAWTFLIYLPFKRKNHEGPRDPFKRRHHGSCKWFFFGQHPFSKRPEKKNIPWHARGGAEKKEGIKERLTQFQNSRWMN